MWSSLTVSSLFLYSVLGLGPAYQGEGFVRVKEVPPAAVAARSSGSLTLSCSVAGSPTPTVGWYKDGYRVTGTKVSPGGLGETGARIHLPCVTEEDAGLYECRGEAGGKHVTASTKVEVVGFPHSGCVPRGRGGMTPAITGWYNTVMIHSGEMVRLVCHVNENSGKVSVVWRDAMGQVITNSDAMRVEGSDLVIASADWSHMGRFTCTAQNGFGVDMVSTFLYPLAPAIPEFSDVA